MPHARRAALALAARALRARRGERERLGARAARARRTRPRTPSLPTAPTSVTLTFTEPPDPRLSSVQVLDCLGGAARDRTRGRGDAGLEHPDRSRRPARRRRLHGRMADRVGGRRPRDRGLVRLQRRDGGAATGRRRARSRPAPRPCRAGSVLARAVDVPRASSSLLGALFVGEVLRDRPRSPARAPARDRLGRSRRSARPASCSRPRPTRASAWPTLIGSTLGADALLRLVPILLAGPLLLLGGRRGGRAARALAARGRPGGARAARRCGGEPRGDGAAARR